MSADTSENNERVYDRRAVINAAIDEYLKYVEPSKKEDARDLLLDEFKNDNDKSASAQSALDRIKTWTGTQLSGDNKEKSDEIMNSVVNVAEKKMEEVVGLQNVNAVKSVTVGNITSTASELARLKLEGDANSDGKVTSQEALAKWDKNKDGRITDKELGGANGLVGSRTTRNGSVTSSIGGVKVENQKDIDKAQFLYDVERIKKGAEAGNAYDKQTLENLDRFFSMTPVERKSFNESVKIAESLRLKNGKSAASRNNRGDDAEWKQAMAMAGEERNKALKEAELIRGMSNFNGMGSSSDTSYRRILSANDVDRSEERRLMNRNQRQTSSPALNVGTEERRLMNSAQGQTSSSPQSVNAIERQASLNRAYGGMPGSSGQGNAKPNSTSPTPAAATSRQASLNRAYGGMPGSSGQGTSKPNTSSVPGEYRPAVALTAGITSSSKSPASTPAKTQPVTFITDSLKTTPPKATKPAYGGSAVAKTTNKTGFSSVSSSAVSSKPNTTKFNDRNRI